MNFLSVGHTGLQLGFRLLVLFSLCRHLFPGAALLALPFNAEFGKQGLDTRVLGGSKPCQDNGTASSSSRLGHGCDFWGSEHA